MSRSGRGFVPINGEVPSHIQEGGSYGIADPITLSSSTLGIIYSLVARNKTILAHHACCHGNFSEVAQQVLMSINRETERRLSYASGEYMYHYLMEEGVVYLCITDDEFERSKAFLFLENVKMRFEDSYKTEAIQSALPFAMNSEFSDILKETMAHYTNALLSMLPMQKLDNIQVRNLELLGDSQLEQLELLESSDSLSRSYESLLLNLQFREKCSYWFKDNWKATLAVLVVAFIVVVVMIAVVLGVCLEDEMNACAR